MSCYIPREIIYFLLITFILKKNEENIIIFKDFQIT